MPLNNCFTKLGAWVVIIKNTNNINCVDNDNHYSNLVLINFLCVLCLVEVLQNSDPQYVDTPTLNVAQPSNMYNPPQQGERTYVKILEQPAPKALRFRYECEGRSAGSIPGVTSTPENKTFPTIQVNHGTHIIITITNLCVSYSLTSCCVYY